MNNNKICINTIIEQLINIAIGMWKNDYINYSGLI